MKFNCHHFATLCVLSTLLYSCAAPTHSGVDRVLYNARIYTVDDKRSWAQAIAINDGQIVYVGSDDGVKQHIGTQTQVDDLNGKMVMPGFHDAHAHVLAGGQTQNLCDMQDARDYDDAYKALVKCSEDPRFTQNEWIVGARWALAAFENGQPPKQWLDDLFDGRPAYFVDSFSHSAWVSSSALALAGIDKDTPDPQDGVIERDPDTGEATGTLRDAAMALVLELTPEDTPETLRAGIISGQRQAAEFGITAYTEPGMNEGHAMAYKQADTDGILTARVLLSLSPKNWAATAFGPEIFDLLAKREAFRGKLVNPDSVKVYIDGVIETRTSYMLEPYEGGNENFPPFYETNKLNDIYQKIDAMGLQVHTHAIGDAAIRHALNAYEHTIKTNGPSENRHQITHLQLINEADIPRFAELNVAADFQSLWAYPDEYIDVAIKEVGLKRTYKFYPINSVVKAGGMIIGGSDWDVSSLNPLMAIEVAVTRQDPWENGGATLNAEERITLATILDAYTRNAAYIMRLDKISGSLEVGKRADLIVLERNLFDIPAYELSDVKVELTLLDGREVYSR